MRTHTHINIFLRLCIFVIALWVCTPAFTQTQKTHEILDKQKAIVDSLEKAGNYKEALRQFNIYDSMYISIRQEAASQEVEQMIETLNKTEQKIQSEQKRLAEMEQRTEMLRRKNEDNYKHLAHDSLHTHLNKAKARAFHLMQERETVRHDSLMQAIDQSIDKANVRSSIIMSISITLIIFTILCVFIIIRVRRANHKLAVATSQMDELRRKAMQADYMKTYFIQNLSHEIRTPLNAVVGFTDLLVNPGIEIDEKEKKMVGQMISNNSEQLITLVGDILDVSNLRSGQVHLTIDNYPVNEILQYAIKTVEGRCTDKVRLYYTSDLDDSYMLQTDITRTRQLLINYLTNACKFTTQGEIHLHCSSTENPGMLTFSVADTGPGIPKQEAENVFTRFEMLDSMKQGTGLGLNICQIIAQNLGGKVWLDTEYTKGARFVFCHPLTQGTPKSKSTKKTRAMMLSAWFALMLLPFTAMAQNNIYNIDDHDYQEYRKTATMSDIQKLNQTIDSLAAVAEKQKHWKAQVLFLSIGLQRNNKDAETMKKYSDLVKKVSLKHDLMQYYFWAYSVNITYLLNHNQLVEAEKTCLELYQKSLQYKDEYGTALYLHNIAKLYYGQGFYALALNYYEKEMEQIREKVPSQDPTNGSNEYLLCLSKLNVPNKELFKITDKLLGEAKTDAMKSCILAFRCRMYYNEKKYDEFLREYETLVSIPANYYNTTNSVFIIAKGMYLSTIGEYDEAMKLAEEISIPADKLARLSKIYEHKGDYKKAFELQKERQDSINKRRNDNTKSIYFEEKMAQFTMNEQLNRQREKLNQLKLAEQELIAKAIEDSLEIHHERYVKDSITLSNEQAAYEVERLKKHNEEAKKRAFYENDSANRSLRRFSTMRGSLLAVLVLVYLIISIRKRKKLKTIYIRTSIAMQQAQESDKNKTAFIRTLSHEIRTPLNAIVGFSTMLTEVPDDFLNEEEKKDAIARIKENTKLLNTIVNDILEMSRLECGKIKMNMRDVSVNSLCNDVITPFREKKPNVKFIFEDLLPKGYICKLDALYMTKALEKVVENAVKFTEKGYVKLVSSLEDNELKISIEDTGIGIPIDKREEIFKQFTKLDSFLPGTGLGLPLARISIEKMNGTLNLDTSYTNGARFVIKIKLDK